MSSLQLSGNEVFSKSVTINSLPHAVWAALTDPSLMKQWMSEAVTDIITDWQVGSPVIIEGQVYKKIFQNKGIVLANEPEKLLEYTHLSSLSRLPDVAENHCHLRFSLQPVDNGTELTLTISTFPTDAIYHHLVFYWNVTLELLKKFMETKDNNL